MADTQSRKYQLTINNPADKDITHESIKRVLQELKSCTYYCMADEIGLENNTPHTHVYIHCKSAVRFSRIKKLFPEAHIEQALGTADENKSYILKTGKWENSDKKDTSINGSFEEWGTIPQESGQGSRSDIETIYDLINNGKTNAEIMAMNPLFASKVNLMDKIRLDILEAQYKETFRNLSVSYVWGPTATGKTRGVFEKYGYENVYRVTDYNHPFDRYASEPVLCLDEFRSNITIGDMLEYLDGYPIALPARYANRVACYETVCIVSNIPITHQYPNIQDVEPETWKAFLRRINHVIEYHQDGTITDHGEALKYVFPAKGFQLIEKQEEIPF